MAESNLIVWEPGLPSTKGWAGLSEVKKKWLQEKTSNIKKYGAMEGLAAVSGALELYRVEQGLEGESMGITDFMKTLYGGNERTGWRKLEQIKQLRSCPGWTDDVIKFVAERGALLLQGATAIGMKDLITVAKEIAGPKEKNEKAYEVFVSTKVRNKLRENRRERGAGRPLKLSKEDGLKILFNSGHRTFRAMRGVHSSADRSEAIETVVGWWMEDLAIPGTLSCRRISIPDGTVARVGRPRKIPKSA